ncbi:MAG: hypothetical protein ASARMPREDX12_007006 [Alectoria sarmentosa]|nr:MAG: hypothetical protein ASARMPREDX12_007006 [Alectoria sarmentosa]
MSKTSLPYSNFKREGPFRYYDLPTEVRDQILRLLLVRGNVAMGKEASIRHRFRSWNHEDPMWELLRVDGLMRAEASAILFSQRNNTFYFPIGGALKGLAGWNMIGNPFFQSVSLMIKKLDCAFDMRDFEVSTFDIFESTKEEQDVIVGNGSFERLSQSEQLEAIHDCYLDHLLEVWDPITEAFGQLRLHLLRLDVSKARCPLGCCRLVKDVVELLDFQGQGPYPRRVELLGVLDHEKDSLKTIIDDRDLMPMDRLFFVDTPGCTCCADSETCSNA